MSAMAVLRGFVFAAAVFGGAAMGGFAPGAGAQEQEGLCPDGARVLARGDILLRAPDDIHFGTAPNGGATTRTCNAGAAALIRLGAEALRGLGGDDGAVELEDEESLLARQRRGVVVNRHSGDDAVNRVAGVLREVFAEMPQVGGELAHILALQLNLDFAHHGGGAVQAEDVEFRAAVVVADADADVVQRDAVSGHQRLERRGERVLYSAREGAAESFAVFHLLAEFLPQLGEVGFGALAVFFGAGVVFLGGGAEVGGEDAQLADQLADDDHLRAGAVGGVRGGGGIFGGGSFHHGRNYSGKICGRRRGSEKKSARPNVFARLKFFRLNVGGQSVL